MQSNNNKDFCSPSNKIESKSISCLNNTKLISIIKAYNTYIKNNKICLHDSCIPSKRIIIKDIEKKTDEQLYKSIDDRLKGICPKEYTWLDLDFINTIPDINLRESILYFTFKPKGTINKYGWLSTTNIDEIMEQYQDIYKNTFKFIGAVPSDYHKIIKLNYIRLKKKNTLGIIFNTDPHDKPGQHWVAIFIDNINKIIEYFDSFGNKPNKNITSFIKNFKDYEFNINSKILQMEDSSECGVFSLNFIIEKLKGRTFLDIINSGINDKMMRKYRGEIFRPT